MPTWNRVRAALPEFLDDFHAAVEADREQALADAR